MLMFYLDTFQKISYNFIKKKHKGYDLLNIVYL